MSTKTYCRRCRKAVKVLNEFFQVCESCANDLVKLHYDLKLLREREERLGHIPKPHPDKMARW